MGSKPNGGVVGRYVEVKINIPYTNEEALGMTVYDQEVSRKIFPKKQIQTLFHWLTV